MNTHPPFSSLHYPEIISGSVIGNRYLIQTILGQGGWGNTYLAVDSYRFYEPCVLKEFNPVLTDADSSLKEKLPDLFEQEAELLYQLNHPQIPKFFAYFLEKGRFFLVQEYIKGKSYCQLLQQRLQHEEIFKETEIIPWLIDLLNILKYIHDRNIIHQDISPQNIIYDDARDLAVLIDFSVGKQSIARLEKESISQSKFINSWSDSMKVTRTLVNKIGYAPYEQIKLGLGFPCSDLYSLGVTTVVLLTGKQPNVLIDWDTLEWQWQIHTSVSDLLARVINKLLAYNPKHRFQSATEVLEALQSLSQPIIIPQTQVATSSDFRQIARESQEQEADLNLEFNEIVSINNNRDRLEPRQTLEGSNPLSKATDLDSELQTPNSELRAQVDLFESEPAVVTSQHYALSPEFIQFCQQKLAYLIGPIANLIVEEILESNEWFSNQEFIEAIAAEIPDWQKSLQFKQIILAEINSFNQKR